MEDQHWKPVFSSSVKCHPSLLSQVLNESARFCRPLASDWVYNPKNGETNHFAGEKFLRADQFTFGQYSSSRTFLFRNIRNIMTTCLISALSPWPVDAWIHLDLWKCVVVPHIKMFAADPASWEVGCHRLDLLIQHISQMIWRPPTCWTCSSCSFRPFLKQGAWKGLW